VADERKSNGTSPVRANHTSARAQGLVDQPSESLDTELKAWLDPAKSHAKGHLVRAALAMRNHGGGQIIIGFNDRTRLPEPPPPDLDVLQAFHGDTLQGLVSRFASTPFPVEVEFGKRNGQLYPVIFVPTGVRTPVVTKSELKGDGGKTEVFCDAVYLRTLTSNNTPSTARASWKDWDHLMEVCFDNREADIGRFIRRHLSTLTPEWVRGLVDTLGLPTAPPAPDPIATLLDVGEQRFAELIEERGLTQVLPKTGFWSAACVIEGTLPPHQPDKTFLQLLEGHNPRYTGWPMWMDSSSFGNATMRPFVYDGTYQALLVNLKGAPPHIDFQWLDPHGQFYSHRALQDDLSGSSGAPPPNTELDFGLLVIRCAEAIAVGLAFAKAMGCDPVSTTLHFAFRWRGLKGRKLTSWAHSHRWLPSSAGALQDVVTVQQRIPLETPNSAIGSVLVSMLTPLFQVFDTSLSPKVIEDLSAELVERRLLF